MPTVKLHYEGWVSLPSDLRRKLGLNSGDRLEADLVNGTIVLRPATKASHPGPRDDQASDHPALTCPRHSRPRPPQPDASQGGREKAKLPTSSPPLRRSARVAGRRRFVRRSPNLRPCVRSAASPGSCGARRTCSPRRRAWRMPRCRVPGLIGPEAKRARRRTSAVRFATSRCASSGRDADTAGLANIPGPLSLVQVSDQAGTRQNGVAFLFSQNGEGTVTAPLRSALQVGMQGSEA